MKRLVKLVFVINTDCQDFELDDVIYEESREFDPEVLVKSYWTDASGLRHYNKGRWTDFVTP